MSSNPGFEPIHYYCEINAAFEMHVALVIAGTDGSQALEALEQVLCMVPEAVIAFVEADFGLLFDFGGIQDFAPPPANRRRRMSLS